MIARKVPVLVGVLALSLTASAQDDKVDFVAQIAPILRQRCIECHGPEESEGGVRMDSRASLFEGDEFDWSVIPGKPDESTMVERIELPADDPDVMPAEGDPLSAEQIALIRAWIEQGANWPPEGDAFFEATSRAPVAAPLQLPELTTEQAAAEAEAWKVLESGSVLIQRVAADTQALDVNFSLLRGEVGDDDLARLRGLEPTLVWLNVSNTKVGDAGLRHLAGMAQLRRLHLANTRVGDAGLLALAGLSNLEDLNLYGTKLTDAGLAHLQGLPRLRKLFLWQTGVTAEGAAALQKQRPELYIDRGDYVTDSSPATAAEPVNDTCPVSGQPVEAGFVTDHEGLLIGFCCAKCKAKFDQDPSAFKAAIDAYRKQTPAGPVNQLCPVSGKAVDPAHVVEHDGRKVGFCCAACKAKFVADPARYAENLPPK